MKEARIKKTRSEMLRELSEQLDLLNDACEKFDQGKKHYGKTIAVILRILLYEYKQSKSLLEQLGFRNYFYDTAGKINDKNYLTENNLLIMKITNVDGSAKAEYIPKLDANPNRTSRIKFVEWWGMPVLRDNKRRCFSRRDLIKHVADTDGGAHVDVDLVQEFHELSRDNSLGWIMFDGESSQPFDERPELACLRQIAYEVLISIKKSQEVNARWC